MRHRVLDLEHDPSRRGVRALSEAPLHVDQLEPQVIDSGPDSNRPTVGDKVNEWIVDRTMVRPDGTHEVEFAQVAPQLPVRVRCHPEDFPDLDFA